jgi:hypothetical protein
MPRDPETRVWRERRKNFRVEWNSPATIYDVDRHLERPCIQPIFPLAARGSQGSERIPSPMSSDYVRHSASGSPVVLCGEPKTLSVLDLCNARRQGAAPQISAQQWMRDRIAKGVSTPLAGRRSCAASSCRLSRAFRRLGPLLRGAPGSGPQGATFLILTKLSYICKNARCASPTTAPLCALGPQPSFRGLGFPVWAPQLAWRRAGPNYHDPLPFTLVCR